MAKELIYKVRIDYDTSSAKQGGQQLERSQENAEQAVDKTTQAIRRQSNAQKESTKQTKHMRNSISGANQTLFSFGDLVNDSAQFQFGFASGSRAVGNNIGFMAEQFSNVQTRAGSFTGALKLMGSSLLGPGGLILGINLVVTALTLFGDKLFGDPDSIANKAKEARKELVDLRKEIDKFDIQFQQLTELQKEAFPDIGQTDALRQQLQFSREIEATLSNRLDTTTSEVDRLQEQVDLLESFEGNQRAILEAQREGLISRRTAETLLNDENAISTTLLSKQNQLSEAKIEQEALQTSINSAREKEVNITAKIAELEASREASTFKALQNIINAQKARGQELLGGPFGFEAVEITAEDLLRLNVQETEIGDFSRDVLGSIRSIKEQEVDIFKETEEAKTAIQKIEERQREELTRQAVSQSVNALAAAFDGFKPLAVAAAVIDGILAIQKTLANVPPPFNYAAAAAMGIATAKNVQKIIATEPGNADAGGLGGQSTSEGFSTTSIAPSASEKRFANQQTQSQPMVIVEANNILPDTEFSVRSERGRKRRERRSRVLTSEGIA